MASYIHFLDNNLFPQSRDSQLTFARGSLLNPHFTETSLTEDKSRKFSSQEIPDGFARTRVIANCGWVKEFLREIAPTRRLVQYERGEERARE